MSAEHGARTRRLVLAVGTVGLFGVHLWFSSRIPGPSVVFDEAGYLGNARWIAGNQHWQMPYSPAYSSGYSLLLAPLFAVIDDPDIQFRSAVMLNAALLASVFPLLFVVLRRLFDVAERPALLAAAIGAIVPATIAAGISAIAENLVLPLVLVSALAAAAMADASRPSRHRWWFGLTAAGLYAAHPRFTAALVVAVAVVVYAAIKRWAGPSVAAVNLATLVGGVLAMKTLNSWVVDARWRDVQKPEGGFGDWWSLLTSTKGIGQVLLSIAGQGWYLLVGSLGLAAVGMIVAIGVLSGRGPALNNRRRASPQVDQQTRQANQLAAAYVVGAAAAVFVTSVLFFARNQFRIDHYVYGRHNDSFSPLWVGLALAYLLTHRRVTSRALLILATVVPIALLGLALNLWRDPMNFANRFSPFASPAIARMVEIDRTRAFLNPTLLAIVGVVAIASVVAIGGWRARRHPASIAGPLVLIIGLGAWFLYAGSETVTGTERFARLNLEEWNTPADIGRLGITSLAVDASAQRARPVLNYPFALPDVAITTFDGARADDPPQGPFVLTSADDAARRSEGSRILLLDEGFLITAYGETAGLAVWVQPGPEQQRLDAMGALLPDGFPTTLPEPARQATIELVDPPTDALTVEAGGSLPLDVRVSHTGSGAPWPDFASFRRPGHVRVVALITAEDPNGAPGARSGGELTSWMIPGDRTQVPVEVFAVDQVLAPLAPGRYRVELAVAQDGEDWVAAGGPDATFTMDVTG